MDLLRWERRLTNVLICVDSQAAILAATGNKPEPGHYILDRQQEALTKKHDHMAMLMRWTPGHRDIAGNEGADEAARKATHHQTTDCPNSFGNGCHIPNRRHDKLSMRS